MATAPLDISALGTANLAAVLLRAKQLAPFGTAGSFTFTADQVKNLAAIKTPQACRLLVHFKLTSGTLTVGADVNSTGSYSSADVTSGAISTTADTFMIVNTTSSDKYVNLRCTSGTTGSEAVVALFEVYVLGLIPDGADAVSIRTPFNALSGDSTWTSGETAG